MPIPLLAFFFLVIYEYIGLGYDFPFLRAFPFALALSVFLLIYVLKSHGPKEFFSHRQAVFLVCFISLTAFALIHGYVKGYAIEPLKQEIGYLFLTIAGFYLIDSKDKINKFVYIFVGIHVYLALLNFGKFHAARIGYYNAGTFLGDGNDFAWSLALALPMSLYLVTIQKGTIRKSLTLSMAGLILYGITGTQSRGAALAVLSSGLFYWFWCSKSKSKGLLLIGLTLITLVMFLPQQYMDRMETIENYEQDSSAMGRIKAWGAATDMALDHPLLGVGAGSFNSVYGRFYRDPSSPVRWISTHSVYFKVLAEYSFIGLLIYILIIYNTITETWSTRRLILENTDRVSINSKWPEFLSMSIVAFSVSAMFLSGVDYPHLYLLIALSMATNRIVSKEISEPYIGEDKATLSEQSKT